MHLIFDQLFVDAKPVNDGYGFEIIAADAHVTSPIVNRRNEWQLESLNVRQMGERLLVSSDGAIVLQTMLHPLSDDVGSVLKDYNAAVVFHLTLSDQAALRMLFADGGGLLS
jgi:hypothetical protein